MIIDMQYADATEGIMAFPDWVFGDIPQQGIIEEVTTVTGSSTGTTISMTGSIGGEE